MNIFVKFRSSSTEEYHFAGNGMFHSRHSCSWRWQGAALVRFLFQRAYSPQLESYRALAAAIDAEVLQSHSPKERFNAASRSSGKKIARAKLKHICRIDERLLGFPTGHSCLRLCQSSLLSLRKPEDTLAHSVIESKIYLHNFRIKFNSWRWGKRTNEHPLVRDV